MNSLTSCQRQESLTLTYLQVKILSPECVYVRIKTLTYQRIITVKSQDSGAVVQV